MVSTSKDVITPLELEFALAKDREWDGQYSSDFQDSLPTGYSSYELACCICILLAIQVVSVHWMLLPLVTQMKILVFDTRLSVADYDLASNLLTLQRLDQVCVKLYLFALDFMLS